MKRFWLVLTLIALPSGALQPEPNDRLRDMLVERLEQSRTTTQQLQDAIDALDNGAPAEEVQRKMMQLWRDRAQEFRSDERRRNRPAEQTLLGNAAPDAERPHGEPGARSRDLAGPEREQALALLQELDPDAAERWKNQPKDDPRADRAMRRILPRLAEMHRLQRDDPEMFALKRDEFRSGRAVAGATREFLRSDRSGQDLETLRATVTEHMATQRRVRELRISRLEQQLEELRGEAESSDDEARADAALQRLLDRVDAFKPGSGETARPERD